MKATRSVAGWTALAGLALCAPVALASEGGSEPEEYKFRAPIIGGVGVTRLEDLRGKPTLIDFWGTK